MKQATSMVISLAVALCLVGGCNKGSGTPGASSGSEGSTGDEAVGTPNSVVHKTGSGSVTAVIGPPGGTLELNGGPRVTIPPGALTEGQEFVLREAPGTTAFLNEEAERPWGPTFEFTPGVNAPEGRTIEVSVPLAAYPEGGWGEVSIGYEYPTGHRVGAEDSEHTRWQYENASQTGGRAVAELPGLNGFRLQFVLTNLEVQ